METGAAAVSTPVAFLLMLLVPAAAVLGARLLRRRLLGPRTGGDLGHGSPVLDHLD